LDQLNLSAGKRPDALAVEQLVKPDFKEYLLSWPKIDDLDLERDNDTGREVEL